MSRPTSTNAPLRFLLVAATLLAMGASLVMADEGMWTYDAPPYKELQSAYGFTPTQEWLDHLRLSSVNIYASASFVSPDGLILTNHHVALGTVQRLSTAEHNYVRDGFYADSPDKELKAPGLSIRVLVSTEDVTTPIREAAAKAKGPVQAKALRDAAKARIEADCLSKTGLQGEVVTLFGGARYVLYRYREYTDVRVVFVPELQAAFFGGDYDNFTYPRYDLDFAFLRAYEDGKPARVKDYLKIEPKGASDGDLVFVSGHPGSTDRLLPLSALTYFRDVKYPAMLDRLHHMEDLLNDYSRRGPEEARRARTFLYFVANSLKAREGEFGGLKDPELMARKAASEKALREAVAASPALKERFGGAWTKADEAYRWAREHETDRSFKLEMPGSRLCGLALRVYRSASELSKPDADRLPGYHEADLQDLTRSVSIPSPYYPDLESVLLADSLKTIVDGLGPEDPFVKALLQGETPDAVAKKVFAGTRFTDAAFRAQLFKGGAKAMGACRDPLIELARRADPFLRATQAAFRENVDSLEEEALTEIGKAGFEVYGNGLYPDASGTLRLAFGKVAGYPFATTLVPPFTTFYGLYDRAFSFGDRGDFELTPRQREHRREVDLSTPLNFVCTADITGGNSGSPVVNREGRLVGLVFDGNQQSHPNSFVYSETQARCVAVDIRGILEALRKIYGAGALADEMTAAAR